MPAWAFIEHNNEVLLVKRSPGTSRPGQWCLPGGGIKSHETAEQACVRECFEETGLQVEVVELLPDCGLGDVFRCRMTDPGQRVVPQCGECDDYCWVAPDRLESVGQIMEYHRMCQLFSLLGLRS